MMTRPVDNTAALIREHIRTKGVTHCPPAAAAITSATIQVDAAQLIRAHSDRLEAERQRKHWGKGHRQKAARKGLARDSETS